MKIAVEIAKILQVAAGTGVVMAPLFIDRLWRQQSQMADMFWKACVVFVLACPVFLWVSGEKERAWKGFVATIGLTLITSWLWAPMVIR